MKYVSKITKYGMFAVVAATMLAAPSMGIAKSKEFNASIWFTETNPLTKHGYLEWAEDVKTQSKGTLKPKVFVGTALLPPAAHLSGLRDGIAQVSYHAGTYTPADLPFDNVLAQLSFLYSDYFLSAFAITDFYINNPQMQEQWNKQEIVFGSGYSTTAYRLFCKKPLKSLADLKGRKIRMPGAAHSNWAQSVGAVPVNVSSSEMYGGLEKGQLDCASNVLTDLKDRSLWDVAKHTTLVELGVYYAGYLHAYNKDFWKSLSGADRRILLNTGAAAIVRIGFGYIKSEKEVTEEAVKHGVTIIEPDKDIEDSIKKFAVNTRKFAVDVGNDKFKLKNTSDFVARFEKTVEKWRGLLAGIDTKDPAALEKLLRTEIYDKINVSSYGVN